MNNLDQFEKMMKGSLEEFEVPFDASQWSRMEQRLGNPSGGSSFPWLAVASVVAVLGSAALLYSYYGTDENSAKLPDTNTTVLKDNSGTVNPIAINENSNSGQINGNSVVTNNHKENHTINNNVLPATNPGNEIRNDQNNPIVNNNGNENKNNNSNPIVENTNENKNNTIAVEPEFNLPAPQFSVTLDEICVGTELDFTPANLPAKTTCSWEINGNGLILTGKKFSFHFTEAGTYTVALTFTNGKQKTTTEKTILVKPAPVVAFGWTETMVNGRPYINFDNRSNDASTYKWVLNGGNTSAEAEPSVFIRNKGEYNITLNAIGANGCVASATEKLVVENDYNLLAPNAFTPNGDNLNNTFIPEALKVMDVNFTMTIYTRDGRLVYQTKSVDKPWDGKFTQDNQLAPQGTYVWVVVIRGEEPYKGYVTVVH